MRGSLTPKEQSAQSSSSLSSSLSTCIIIIRAMVCHINKLRRRGTFHLPWLIRKPSILTPMQAWCQASSICHMGGWIAGEFTTLNNPRKDTRPTASERERDWKGKARFEEWGGGGFDFMESVLVMNEFTMRWRSLRKRDSNSIRWEMSEWARRIPRVIFSAKNVRKFQEQPLYRV